MTLSNNDEFPELPPEVLFKGYKQAAEAGNVSAIQELIKCYENGIGTEIDSKAAEYWRNELQKVLPTEHNI